MAGEQRVSERVRMKRGGREKQEVNIQDLAEQ